ncbi:MAG: hypothetical protein LBT09_03440, partial [Planctomycetaceae bacterium]|nr:hypothetical protein [Planctomycetaceae bacterium]
MKKICIIFLSAIFLSSGIEAIFAENTATKNVETKNIAPSATVTANSEYSGHYAAKFVTDGVIPEAGSRNDLNHSWCVNNETAKNYGELILQWTQPVEVA